MTGTYGKKIVGYAGAALILIVAAATAVHAIDAEDGRKLYLRYCGACHGESAKGDGVVSQAMRPHPTDLTELAKNAGGSFQTADIAGRIDGRETSRVHGDPDMPVWGEVLSTRGANAGSAEDKVVLITEYLKSIQQK